MIPPFGLISKETPVTKIGCPQAIVGLWVQAASVFQVCDVPGFTGLFLKVEVVVGECHEGSSCLTIPTRPRAASALKPKPSILSILYPALPRTGADLRVPFVLCLAVA